MNDCDSYALYCSMVLQETGGAASSIDPASLPRVKSAFAPRKPVIP